MPVNSSGLSVSPPPLGGFGGFREVADGPDGVEEAGGVEAGGVEEAGGVCWLGGGGNTGWLAWKENRKNVHYVSDEVIR